MIKLNDTYNRKMVQEHAEKIDKKIYRWRLTRVSNNPYRCKVELREVDVSIGCSTRNGWYQQNITPRQALMLEWLVLEMEHDLPQFNSWTLYNRITSTL